jgi:hypothetical protein
LKSDCRPLFPSATELTQLLYVGGDGQSVKTNPPPNAPPLVALPSPLQVGVANGQFPIVNAQVRFTVAAGQLPNGTQTQIVPTDANGLASIAWSLASDPGQPVQHATAELLVAGQVVAGRYLPVHFSAQLALASAVAYDPANCADLQAANAYTVQAAIDALCKRTHGGGCCVVVGPTGEFATLDAALRSLLGQDQRDICICLLPGDHSLADDLKLTGSLRHHLSIHGAGPASRLRLKGQLLQFDTFAALSLKDLVVTNTGDPRSISLLNCRELQLSEVQFSGRSSTGNSLLRIAGSGQLLMQECELFAVAANSDQKADYVFQHVPGLAPFKGAFTANASLDGSLTQATETMAALNAADRKQMAADITAMLRTALPADLGPWEQAALNTLRGMLGNSDLTLALSRALEQVVTALRTGPQAFALSLDDTDDASLVDNRVRGRITLYGESDDMADLTPDQIKRLSAAMKAGAVTFTDGGSLVLERNLLQGLRISGKAVSKVISTAKGALPVWHTLQVTDNHIQSTNDHYPGFNCAFNGNTLEPVGDVGVLMANQAKIIGNFSHNADLHLYVAGTNPESFGNGQLNILPL